MLPEVTYGDYTLHGGMHDKDLFLTSLRAAKAAVSETIWLNEPVDDLDAEAYVRAVCAAVDVDIAYGQSAGIAEDAASLSIGSFSIGSGSSGTSSLSAYDSDMRRAIRRELIGSTLLFQGVD